MNGIILDTNVVSEPERPAPDPKVRSWFAAQDVDRLYLTTTVLAELAVGIERLPPGRRRTDFRRWLEALVRENFAGRILVFDVTAALIYGKLVAAALARGRPPTVGDAQIAASRVATGWPWHHATSGISRHWRCRSSIPGMAE